jgi:hypothetical protein
MKRNLLTLFFVFGCQCAELASEQTAQATILKLELTIRFLHSKVRYLENA